MRGDALQRRHPRRSSRLSLICKPEAGESASFDEALELLHLSGRSLPHAELMMIPEAWETNITMDEAERAF
jgi:glutamate synthase domain-containing protein 1